MTLVAEWAKAFDEMTGEYREVQVTKSVAQKLNKPQAAFHQRILKSIRKGKNWMVRKVWVGLSAHSIVNIFTSKHSDTFSMGDKMFVQTNVFVTMLSFAIGFYFSKATNCCEERKIYLGCSVDGRFSECMGYATCMDLNTAERDLPEELTAGSFVCLAFPQDVLMHRLVIVLIMVRAEKETLKGGVRC
jgi:hypothetical protein